MIVNLSKASMLLLGYDTVRLYIIPSIQIINLFISQNLIQQIQWTLQDTLLIVISV
jgi:hypothetical protein